MIKFFKLYVKLNNIDVNLASLFIEASAAYTGTFNVNVIDDWSKGYIQGLRYSSRKNLKSIINFIRTEYKEKLK